MDGLSLFVIVFAVGLLGVAKAGFGGVGTPVALPLMSVALPPDVALGILLPLLLATDVVSVSAHRKNMDWPTIAFALPGALIGVLLGAAVIARASPDVIAGSVGVLAILFAILALTDRNPSIAHWPNWVGSVFGSVSGLTSTLAHAGGPPIHIYLLSKAYAPKVFVATAAGFMAGVNVLKIGPFIAIGALDRHALLWALALAPVAIASALAGVYIARILSRKAFKYSVNALLIIAGVKLIFDAVT